MCIASVSTVDRAWDVARVRLDRAVNSRVDAVVEF